MDKFFKLFAIITLSLVSFGANAHTVWLQTDAVGTGLVKVIDEANGIDLTLTEEPQAVEDLLSGNFIVSVPEGYVLGAIESLQTSGAPGYHIDVTDNWYTEFTMNWGRFQDGLTVTVHAHNIQNLDSKLVTFTGEPGSYYVTTSDFRQLDPDENGRIEKFDYKGVTAFSVYARDGYRISSIKDNNDVYYGNFPGDYGTFKTNYFSAPQLTLTVATINLNEAEGSQFTVNVYNHKNQFYKVSLHYERGTKSVQIKGETQSVPFDNGTEFTLSNTYGGAFYKVLLNENELELKSDSYYPFTPKDGDVLSVYINQPEEPVPFEVSFAGDADASIIQSVNYTGNFSYGADEILDPLFAPLLGEKLTLNFDSDKFKNIAVKVNGEPQENNDRLEMSIIDPAGYKLEVYGEKKLTSIDEISATGSENVEIYNLQGIRVDSANITPGIYIVNGKKISIR